MFINQYSYSFWKGEEKGVYKKNEAATEYPTPHTKAKISDNRVSGRSLLFKFFFFFLHFLTFDINRFLPTMMRLVRDRDEDALKGGELIERTRPVGQKATQPEPTPQTRTPLIASDANKPSQVETKSRPQPQTQPQSAFVPVIEKKQV